MNRKTGEIKKNHAGRSLLIFGLWVIAAAVSVVSANAQNYPCTNAIYFTSNGSTDVYRYTPSTNSITRVPGTSIAAASAASAIVPSGARLYSVDGATPFALRYNSGGTANATAATTAATTTPQRNAIAPDGTGYFMVGAAGSGVYYRYTTGGATSTVTTGSLTVQPASAPALGNGGDITFDSNGVAYLLDQAKNFYRLDFTNNIANYVGAVTGVAENPNGLGFSVTNSGVYELYVSTLGNALYRINLATLAATPVTPSATVSGFTQNDIASCIYPPNVVPNVAAIKAWRNVTKGDANTFTTSTAATVGDTLEYRVVVRNTGAIAAGNTTFQDAIPSGLNYIAATTTLNGVAVADSAGTGNARFYYGSARTIQGYGQAADSGALRVDSTPGTLTDNEAVVTFRVTVGNPFVGTANPIPNTAAVNYAGAPAVVNSNTVNTPVLLPDLTIAKSHAGNFVRGATGIYTVTVTNSGTAATAGTITVADTLPAGMTVNNGLAGAVTPGGTNAANWSCASNAAAPQVITCTSATAISNAAGGNSSVFSLTVNVSAATASQVTNTVNVSGGGEPTVNGGNNSASDATTVVSAYRISGTIFEDFGYAGGAGRSLSASGGTPRGAATVELYNSGGAFIASTTTATGAAAGQYQFTNLAPGGYTVRVVNSTVSSARGGYVSTLIGVQTFRTNNGTNDANRVGGENPAKIDAAANTSNAALSSLTTTTTAAQSISAVTIASANVAGVDFGYNFDTVVNVNDSGQGSLRQFVANANSLSGADTTIFMISDGSARGGLQAGLPNQLTGGAARIVLASLLPALTDAGTTIDGTTQTANVGNTNSGSLGTGGAVGVDNLTLSTVQRPEVLITDGATNLAVGLDLQGASQIVRGLTIYGFGTGANTDSSANVRLGAGAAGALIEQNVLGSNGGAFADPGAGTRSVGDNVRSLGADNGVLRNNLIGFSEGKGFGVESGSTGWTIENNEIRGNGINNSNLDGIDFESAGTTGNTARGNLIADNEANGIDSYQSNGSNAVVNNTIVGNGTGANSNVETPGVRLYGANNLVERNKIYANYGAGVMVTGGSTSNTITRNSIYANGTITTKTGGAPSNQIGIDLLAAADRETVGTAPFVTPNDAGDADAGANGLLNFPVLEAARLVGGNLVLTGFARPGAAVEFFVAAPDASGFGEGQTYLLTLTEGSPQDADATAGTYTSPFGGRNVGTDTTNRFQFTVAVPSGVSAGTVLTATATVAAATSEFGNTISVADAPPAVALVKSVAPDGAVTPGTELTYSIAFSNVGGQPATGFTLTDPNPAGTLRINTNTDFKVGSVTNALGTTGLTVAVAYSNDNAATFAYAPVSGGGGAAAGYDRNVTHIRWTFTGSLSRVAPNNSGSVSFTVKIR